MSEWKEMDSAPRDGTKILLGCFGGVADGCEDRLGTVAVDFWHDPEEQGFRGWGKFNAEYWPPTHWMPLPSPPKPITMENER